MSHIQSPRLLKSLIIRLLRVFRIRKAEPNTFLIPAYTGLGNFIMMTPMILALKRGNPRARIFILAGNSYGTEAVFDPADGIIEHVYWLSPKAPISAKLLFFIKLRKNRIGTVFLPFDASPSFVWWGVMVSGIPRRIGHTVDVLGIEMAWTRTVLTQPIPLRLDTHESDLHYDLLDALENKALPRRYATTASSMPESTLTAFGLAKGAYIVVQITAHNSLPTPKKWPTSNFAALIEELERLGELVVLPGDACERREVIDFIEQYQLKAIPLAGRTTIQEVSTIIKHAKLVICHDSGVMHIANAHQTPLIALYGPTDRIFTEPKASTSLIIQSNLPCVPCMKNFAKTEEKVLQDCPINIACMPAITVERVLDQAKEILSMTPERRATNFS
jgi:ADP-heptose:LPS heptosyltransferase